MAERGYGSSEDRWRSDRERDRGRGFTERAADEVRSWFGDEEAERRRRELDDRERGLGRERAWSNDRPRDEWRGRSEWNDRDREREWNRDRQRHDTDRDRDYRNAGETILGRADWGGGRESDYEHGFRAMRESGWRERDEASAWRPERTDSGQGGYGVSYGSAASATQQWKRSGPPEGDDRWRYQSSHAQGYSGRGPRNYRRSDQRTLEDVCDRLTDDPRVDASDIEVRCENGAITLEGTVRSREEKRRAEDVAESVAGVNDVTNHLRVSSGVLGNQGSPQTPLGLSSPGGESRGIAHPGSAEERSNRK